MPQPPFVLTTPRGISDGIGNLPLQEESMPPLRYSERTPKNDSSGSLWTIHELLLAALKQHQQDMEAQHKNICSVVESRISQLEEAIRQDIADFGAKCSSPGNDCQSRVANGNGHWQILPSSEGNLSKSQAPYATEPNIPPIGEDCSEDCDITVSTEEAPHTADDGRAGVLRRICSSFQNRAQQEDGVKMKTCNSLQREVQGDRNLSCREKLRLYEGRFEAVCGMAIVLNAVAMICQLEVQRRKAAVDLGLESSGTKQFWDINFNFDGLEHVFNIFFLLELCLRVYLLRGLSYFCSVANFGDALVVLLTCFHAYGLQLFTSNEDSMTNLSAARLIRLLRVVKVFRAFRAAAMFSELRVLIHTLIASMMALVWSTVLLGLIMVSSGILMGQLAAGCINDPTHSYELRLWTYRHYGGAFRPIYTMFEATLSGGWPNYARRLVEEVSVWFALFWMVYVLAIVFAVIRVLTALFLRTTLNAANQDEDMMIMAKVKERDTYSKRLRHFFKEADLSGDGKLDKDEFQKVLGHQKMQAWLEVLELEVHEVEALFDLLADGTGNMKYDDFMAGAMRMKGQAKAIDQITIMHAQSRILQTIQEVGEGLGEMWRRLNLGDNENPWLDKKASLGASIHTLITKCTTDLRDEDLLSHVASDRNSDRSDRNSAGLVHVRTS